MTRKTRFAFFLGAVTSFAVASYGCGGASKGGLPFEEIDAADGTGTVPGGGSGSTPSGTGGSAMMMTPGGGGRPGSANMGGTMAPAGPRPDGGFVFPQPPRVTDGGIIQRPNNACMAGSMCMAGQTCAASCNNGRGTQNCTCFQDRYACGACDAPDGGNVNPFQVTACPAGNPNGLACTGNSNCTSATDGGFPSFCRCDNGSWNCPFLPQPACAADVMDNGICTTRGARCDQAAVPNDAGRQGRTRECQCDNNNNMLHWRCR